jgi:uncharacterized protein
MDLFGGTMFIIIKPTELCNLDCAYCFIDKKPLYSKTSVTDATKILHSIQEYARANPHKRTTVCWHGGEPLTLGVKFYEHVLTKFPDIRQTIQTNLTLFNEDFSSLFAEHHVSISTSLDGPEHYHNLSRRFRGGIGSFQSVIDGIELAKRKNIKVGVICMLSKLNLGEINVLYDFFKSLGLPYKINSIHKVGRNDYDATAISYQEYANTLVYFFERFLLDPTPGLPEGQSFRFARSLLVNFNPACPFLSNCQDSIVSINGNGDVFPCESFPHLKNSSSFFYGNVFEKSFSEIMNSDNRKIVLSRRIETLTNCSSCRYGQICNGGCMIEGVIRRGRLFDRTAQCSDIKYMLSRFEEILQQTGLAQTFRTMAAEREIELDTVL